MRAFVKISAAIVAAFILAACSNNEADIQPSAATAASATAVAANSDGEVPAGKPFDMRIGAQPAGTLVVTDTVACGQSMPVSGVYFETGAGDDPKPYGDVQLLGNTATSVAITHWVYPGDYIINVGCGYRPGGYEWLYEYSVPAHSDTGGSLVVCGRYNAPCTID